MITQKIIARTDSLKLDKIISRYGEDSMRQVVFIIVRPDPESEELIPITIPEDAVGSFRILKPSGNFVIVPMSKSVLSTGETAFDVVLPASANTAKGSGYYDIRITSDADKYYFTAQGDFLIDDNIISDEVLEDVSEVNGLIFPDDFLTVEDHVTYIDDDTISTDSTWSSNKINEEIEAHAGGDVSKTVSGNPVTFTDGAAAPLVKCDVTISPQQDLHGYDKPWVGGAGKNKLYVDATSKTIQGVTYTVESDGEVKCNGLSSDSNFAWIHICSNEEFNKLGLVSGQSYILNGNVNPTKGLLYIETTNNIHMYEDTGSGVQFTYNGETNWRVSYVANFSTNFNNELIAKPMIRLSTETDPTFTPYSNICPISGYSSVGVNVAAYTTDTPQTFTVNFGGTYYAGYVDTVRGVFVGTHGYDEFDGTATVTISRSGYDNWYYTISNGGYAGANTSNVICNKYVGAGVTDNTDVLGVRKQSSGSVRVRTGGTEPADVSGFLAELTKTHLQLVYPLVTPFEITLTPQVIYSLFGDNAMWTDGDNLEVEYITQRFQPLIDSIKQL